MLTDNEANDLLIDLIFKPDANGKRPSAAEIQLQLAFISGILSEAQALDMVKQPTKPSPPKARRKVASRKPKDPECT